MRKAKLVTLVILVLSFSLMLLTPVTSNAAKKRKPKKGTTNAAAAMGAQVFDVNCTTCHPGGINTIEAEKTLMSDALKTNGFNSVDDVKKRIEEGAGIMPAFKEQLKPEEIDAAANYVWDQAQKGWK